MNFRSCIALSAALMLTTGPSLAQSLTMQQRSQPLAERVQERPVAMPARGMTMAKVEATYGAPQQKLEPRGGQKSQWPTINRWVYPGFTVYFEKNKVVDAVANRANANEIGPKPPIR